MLRAKSRTMRNGNLTLNQQNIRVERPSALHILITYSARYSKKPVTNSAWYLYHHETKNNKFHCKIADRKNCPMTMQKSYQIFISQKWHHSS